MKIFNTTTASIEEITYIFNGCDCLPDVHGNSGHGNNWNDAEGCWEMTQEDVDWWTKYVADNETADKMAAELIADGLSSEIVRDVQESAVDGDMEDHGPQRIASLKNLAEAKTNGRD